MLPYINIPFIWVSDLTGVSADELKLVSSFFLSYPLAALLYRIPDTQPWKKNVFIIGVSMFYLVGLFDLWDGLRTLLYCSAGAYAIAYFVDGSIMPWIAFLFLIGYMSISHIIRQIVHSPSSVDITGAQMVLVMKLSAFCWNVHDGRLPQNQLTEAQKHAAIKKFPTLLDFAGYVFFFPSLFAGPACDFVEHQRWIEGTMFDKQSETDSAKTSTTRKKKKIYPGHYPVIQKIVQGVLHLVAFVQLSGIYNTELLLSKEYMTYGFLRRVWILYLYGFTTRMKYYGVWSLTEGACIKSGMGYNGIDEQTGHARWNRLENVDFVRLEKAQNPHAYLGNWNKNTNHWLRNYVYLRVTPKGKKPGFRASLATFATSAVWHGFYPGYYLTFLLGAFVQTSAKSFRRHVRPFFLTPDVSKPTPSKRYYDIASWITTQFAFSFVTAPFVILKFGDCVTVWARVNFYCIICVASSMIFFASPAKRYLIQRLDRRNKAYAPATPGAPTRAIPSRRPSSRESIAASKARERAMRSAMELSEDEVGPQPALGLPDDLAEDVDQAMQEIKREIGLRRRRGSVVAMPSGAALINSLEDKLGKKLT